MSGRPKRGPGRPRSTDTVLSPTRCAPPASPLTPDSEEGFMMNEPRTARSRGRPKGPIKKTRVNAQSKLKSPIRATPGGSRSNTPRCDSDCMSDHSGIKDTSPFSVIVDAMGQPLIPEATTDQTTRPSDLEEEMMLKDKLCAFCNCGPERRMFQGKLQRCAPTIGFNPFKKSIQTNRQKHNFTPEFQSSEPADTGKEAIDDVHLPQPMVHRRGPGRPPGRGRKKGAVVIGLPLRNSTQNMTPDKYTFGTVKEKEVHEAFESDGSVWAHHCCASWSEGVCQTDSYDLVNVDKAVSEAMTERCAHCSRFGASVVCQWARCGKTYHYPCAASAGAFQEIHSMTMLCPDHLEEAGHLGGAEAQCYLCGEGKDFAEMLFCTSCGRHYHGRCLDPAVDITSLVRMGWQCPDCKVCQGCRQPGDDNKMLVCDVCDKGYHTYCLEPPMTTIPKTGWKCLGCRRCEDCGSNTPGGGPTSRWHRNYTVCDSCYQQRNKGLFCPLCGRAYRQLSDVAMVQCEICTKWLHAECDNVDTETYKRIDAKTIPYHCPNCKVKKERGLLDDKDSLSYDDNPMRDVDAVMLQDADEDRRTLTSAALGRITPCPMDDVLIGSGLDNNLDDLNPLQSFGDSLMGPENIALEPDSKLPMDEEMEVVAKSDMDMFSSSSGLPESPPQSDNTQEEKVFSGPSYYGPSRFTTTPPKTGGKRKLGPRLKSKTSGTPAKKKSKHGKPGRPPTKLKKQTSVQASPGKENNSGVANVVESATKEEESEGLHSTLVLFSADDEFTTKQDMCLCCGSFGKGREGQLIMCSQCGQSYHPFCVGVKVNKIILSKGWRCLDCTLCEGCGKGSDEARLLLCDSCDISYHTYCLAPPLGKVPQGGWKCKWCVTCYDCGSSSPGTECEWQSNYTQCAPCASKITCPVCNIKYNVNDLMLQCLNCNRWLHGSCDELLTEDEVDKAADYGYHCLYCRPKTKRSLVGLSGPPSPRATALHHYRPQLSLESHPPQPQAKPIHPCQRLTNNGLVEMKLSSQLSRGVGVNQHSTIDNVFLTDSGVKQLSRLKLSPAARKKVKVKNKVKPKKFGVGSPSIPIKKIGVKSPELDDPIRPDHFDDNAVDFSSKMAENAPRGNRQKNAYRPGIGGFLVRGRGAAARKFGGRGPRGTPRRKGFDQLFGSPYRSRAQGMTSPARQQQNSVDSLMETSSNEAWPDNKDRTSGASIQQAYPGWMQEAFFGRDLLNINTRKRKPKHEAGTPSAPSEDDENASMDPFNQQHAQMSNPAHTKIGQGQQARYLVSGQQSYPMVGVSEEGQRHHQASHPGHQQRPTGHHPDVGLEGGDGWHGTSADGLPSDALTLPDDFPNPDALYTSLDMLTDDMPMLAQDGHHPARSMHQDQPRPQGTHSQPDLGHSPSLTSPSQAQENLMHLQNRQHQGNDLDLLSSDLDILPHVDGQEVEEIFAGIEMEMKSREANYIGMEDNSQTSIPPPHSQQMSRQGSDTHITRPAGYQAGQQELPAYQQGSRNQGFDQTLSHHFEPVQGRYAQFSQERDNFPGRPDGRVQHGLGTLGQFGLDNDHAFPKKHDFDLASDLPRERRRPPSPRADPLKQQQKWQEDEKLGGMSTISPVLYANLEHPNLNQEYAEWTNRYRAIARLWRKLSVEQREPFRLKARDNRVRLKDQEKRLLKQNEEKNAVVPVKPAVLPQSEIRKEAPAKQIKEEVLTQHELPQPLPQHHPVVQVPVEQQGLSVPAHPLILATLEPLNDPTQTRPLTPTTPLNISAPSTPVNLAAPKTPVTPTSPDGSLDMLTSASLDGVTGGKGSRGSKAKKTKEDKEKEKEKKKQKLKIQQEQERQWKLLQQKRQLEQQRQQQQQQQETHMMRQELKRTQQCKGLRVPDEKKKKSPQKASKKAHNEGPFGSGQNDDQDQDQCSNVSGLDLHSDTTMQQSPAMSLTSEGSCSLRAVPLEESLLPSQAMTTESRRERRGSLPSLGISNHGLEDIGPLSPATSADHDHIVEMVNQPTSQQMPQGSWDELHGLHSEEIPPQSVDGPMWSQSSANMMPQSQQLNEHNAPTLSGPRQSASEVHMTPHSWQDRPLSLPTDHQSVQEQIPQEVVQNDVVPFQNQEQVWQNQAIVVSKQRRPSQPSEVPSEGMPLPPRNPRHDDLLEIPFAPPGNSGMVGNQQSRTMDSSVPLPQQQQGVPVLWQQAMVQGHPQEASQGNIPIPQISQPPILLQQGQSFLQHSDLPPRTHPYEMQPGWQHPSSSGSGTLPMQQEPAIQHQSPLPTQPSTPPPSSTPQQRTMMQPLTQYSQVSETASDQQQPPQHPSEMPQPAIQPAPSVPPPPPPPPLQTIQLQGQPVTNVHQPPADEQQQQQQLELLQKQQREQLMRAQQQQFLQIQMQQQQLLQQQQQQQQAAAAQPTFARARLNQVVNTKDMPEIESEEEHQERLRFLYRQRQLQKQQQIQLQVQVAHQTIFQQQWTAQGFMPGLIPADPANPQMIPPQIRAQAPELVQQQLLMEYQRRMHQHQEHGQQTVQELHQQQGVQSPNSQQPPMLDISHERFPLRHPTPGLQPTQIAAMMPGQVTMYGVDGQQLYRMQLQQQHILMQQQQPQRLLPQKATPQSSQAPAKDFTPEKTETKAVSNQMEDPNVQNEAQSNISELKETDGEGASQVASEGGPEGKGREQNDRNYAVNTEKAKPDGMQERENAEGDKEATSEHNSRQLCRDSRCNKSGCLESERDDTVGESTSCTSEGQSSTGNVVQTDMSSQESRVAHESQDEGKQNLDKQMIDQSAQRKFTNTTNSSMTFHDTAVSNAFTEKEGHSSRYVARDDSQVPDTLQESEMSRNKKNSENLVDSSQFNKQAHEYKSDVEGFTPTSLPVTDSAEHPSPASSALQPVQSDAVKVEVDSRYSTTEQTKQRSDIQPVLLKAENQTQDSEYSSQPQTQVPMTQSQVQVQPQPYPVPNSGASQSFPGNQQQLLHQQLMGMQQKFFQMQQQRQIMMQQYQQLQQQLQQNQDPMVGAQLMALQQQGQFLQQNMLQVWQHMQMAQQQLQSQIKPGASPGLQQQQLLPQPSAQGTSPGPVSQGQQWPPGPGPEQLGGIQQGMIPLRPGLMTMPGIPIMPGLMPPVMPGQPMQQRPEGKPAGTPSPKPEKPPRKPRKSRGKSKDSLTPQASPLPGQSAPTDWMGQQPKTTKATSKPRGKKGKKQQEPLIEDPEVQLQQQRLQQQILQQIEQRHRLIQQRNEPGSSHEMGPLTPQPLGPQKLQPVGPPTPQPMAPQTPLSMGPPTPQPSGPQTSQYIGATNMQQITPSTSQMSHIVPQQIGSQATQQISSSAPQQIGHPPAQQMLTPQQGGNLTPQMDPPPSPMGPMSAIQLDSPKPPPLNLQAVRPPIEELSKPEPGSPFQTVTHPSEPQSPRTAESFAQRFPTPEHYLQYTQQQLRQRQPIVEYVADANNPFSDDFRVVQTKTKKPKAQSKRRRTTAKEKNTSKKPVSSKVDSVAPPVLPEVQKGVPSAKESTEPAHEQPAVPEETNSERVALHKGGSRQSTESQLEPIIKRKDDSLAGVDNSRTGQDETEGCNERNDVVATKNDDSTTGSGTSKVSSNEESSSNPEDINAGSKKVVCSGALQKLESMVAGMASEEEACKDQEQPTDTEELEHDIFNEGTDQEVANLCSLASMVSPLSEIDREHYSRKEGSQANSVVSLECHEEVPSFISPVQEDSNTEKKSEGKSQETSPVPQPSLNSDSKAVSSLSPTEKRDDLSSLTETKVMESEEPQNFDESVSVTQQPIDFTYSQESLAVAREVSQADDRLKPTHSAAIETSSLKAMQDRTEENQVVSQESLSTIINSQETRQHPLTTPPLLQPIKTNVIGSGISVNELSPSSLSSGVLGEQLSLPVGTQSSDVDGLEHPTVSLDQFNTHVSDVPFSMSNSITTVTSHGPDHEALMDSGRDPMLGGESPMLTGGREPMLGHSPVPKGAIKPQAATKTKSKKVKEDLEKITQEEDPRERTINDLRKQEYERKKREFEEQQRRKRVAQKELREQKIKDKEERKRQRSLLLPNKVKSKENQIQKGRKSDASATQKVSDDSNLPLCEPKLLLTHALMHPYGTSPFNGQCALKGCFGSANLDNSNDYYSKFPSPDLDVVLATVNHQKTLVNGDISVEGQYEVIGAESKPLLKMRELNDLPSRLARYNEHQNEALQGLVAPANGLPGESDVIRKVLEVKHASALSTENSSVNSSTSSPETVQYIPSSSPESDATNKRQVPNFPALNSHRDSSDSPTFPPPNAANIKRERLGSDMFAMSSCAASVRSDGIRFTVPKSTRTNNRCQTMTVTRTGPLLGLEQDIDDLDSINVTLTLSPTSEMRVSETVASVADLIGCSPPRPSDIVIEPTWKASVSSPSPVTSLATSAGHTFSQSRTSHSLAVASPKAVDQFQKSPYPYTQFNLSSENEPQRKKPDGPYCRHCDVLIIGIGVIREPSDQSELKPKPDEVSQTESRLEKSDFKIYSINVEGGDTGDFFCSEACLEQYYSHLEAASAPGNKTRTKVFNANSEGPVSVGQATSAANSFTIDGEQEERGGLAADGIPETALLKVRRPSWKEENAVGENDVKRRREIKWRRWQTSDYKEAEHRTKQELCADEVAELLDKYGVLFKSMNVPEDTRTCTLCRVSGDGETEGTSRLLNLDVDVWVHLNCALWSLEVYETLNGALMNVESAVKRGISTNCCVCDKTGATVVCNHVNFYNKLRCTNTYHFGCAIKNGCMFFKDKTMLCHEHRPNDDRQDRLPSYAVFRKVFINRNEIQQIASMLRHNQESGGDKPQTLRIGSLVVKTLGQLLLHQLQTFHTRDAVFPVGFKTIRFYWSIRTVKKRCRYHCSVEEIEGKPSFSIRVDEDGHEDIFFRGKSPKDAWRHVLEPIQAMRKETQLVNLWPAYVTGEGLFGLTEQFVLRIIESMPGVDYMQGYNMRYGPSPIMELPLAVNPTGCARSEPLMKTHFRSTRARALRTTTSSSSSSSRASASASREAEESYSLYMKQFVYSKASQYRKLKTEWRHNVFLGRSNIQGLGLFANRDMEPGSMVIEYIGAIIRNEVANKKERIYESQNRGIYMFRIDSESVIDATIAGGPARYINHSCMPNCVAEVVTFEKEQKIIIISSRKVEKGEELTYDYKFDFEDDEHKISCLCGAANCRKWMN